MAKPSRRPPLATEDPDNPFHKALDRWCGGRPDEQTLALIG
jgi:hypothetical protein